MSPDNRKRFEEIGVEGVKARLISGHHYGGTWVEDAITWIAEQDQLERERISASQALAERNAARDRLYDHKERLIDRRLLIVAIVISVISAIISFLAWQMPRH